MKHREPGIDLVTVKFSIPKAFNDFVTKLADIEGTKLNSWYLEAAFSYVDGLLGNAHDVFNVQRLIVHNGLKGFVKVSD